MRSVCCVFNMNFKWFYAVFSLPQALGGVPGSQPLLPSGMDPTRQQGECGTLHSAVLTNWHLSENL